MTIVAASSDSMLRIAQTVCWWRPPEEVVAEPVQFAARVMALATWDDVLTVWWTLGDDIFRAALREARPGVFDRRSWAFWHRVFGLEAPPLPRRPFIPDEEYVAARLDVPWNKRYGRDESLFAIKASDV